MQRQKTPDVHFDIADWLEEAWRAEEETRLLLQAFRSCGKSTIVGLYAAWILYQRPACRILVLAADAMLARKMVRNVKRIIERHPFTAHLKPERADQWGADRFTIKRDKELRDPSMLAKGISSNITGSRADIIICDDVEVPKTCDTAQKRQDLRDRLGETAYVLVPGGTQLYVGTPHSWFTLYADVPRHEIGEETPFLDGFSRFTLPILDRHGNSAWPERFSEDDIAMMRRTSGPNKFTSQMMLVPVNIADGYLDAENLRFYDAPIVKNDALRALYIEDKRLVSASAWWDPAFGKRDGDASVLAILYTDEDGDYWLQHVEYIRITEEADICHSDDEATQQCRIVAALAKRFYLPSVCIEINGIGRFLPNILRREMAQQNIPCAVVEKVSSQAKDLRIMEAFDAVMAARALHVNAQVRSTPFLTEMQEWSPGQKGGHDDGLDAVAGALAAEPIRLKRYYTTGQQVWRKGRDMHEANSDFDV